MAEKWGIPQTLQNAAAATGNGASFNLGDWGAASIAISGTFVGTVIFEASMDGGTTWFAVKALNRTSETSATTATAPGLFYLALPGVALLRTRVSAYTSGSITVIGVATMLLASPSVASTGGGGGSISTTDDLAEGSTNKYFTAARVLAVVLTGLSLVTGTAVTATDTILVAIGKLQKQITDLIASVATALSGKQDALGFTPEDAANKDADSTFAANSDDKYPSQKAVKTAMALKLDGLEVADATARLALTGLGRNAEVYQVDTGFTYKLTDPSAPTDAVSWAAQPKVFSAVLDQADTAPPIPTIHGDNPLGILAEDFTYDTQGRYLLTKTGMFVRGATMVSIGTPQSLSDVLLAYRTGDDVINIRTFHNGENSDFRLIDTAFEIRVYPA